MLVWTRTWKFSASLPTGEKASQKTEIEICVKVSYLFVLTFKCKLSGTYETAVQYISAHMTKANIKLFLHTVVKMNCVGSKLVRALLSTRRLVNAPFFLHSCFL